MVYTYSAIGKPTWNTTKPKTPYMSSNSSATETTETHYINLEKALFQNADDEFHVKVVHNLDEACKLLEVGLEYFTDLNGAKLFRKRK